MTRAENPPGAARRMGEADVVVADRHSSDPVVALARRQGRDLRRWLYEDEAGEPASFAAALNRAAADIEDAHGVPIEVVSALLGHSSVAVTSSVYGHLTAEDARAALEKAGWLTGKEVQW